MNAPRIAEQQTTLLIPRDDLTALLSTPGMARESARALVAQRVRQRRNDRRNGLAVTKRRWSR